VLAVLAMALVSEGKRSASSSVAESEGDEPIRESGSMSSAVHEKLCVSQSPQGAERVDLESSNVKPGPYLTYWGLRPGIWIITARDFFRSKGNQRKEGAKLRLLAM
jgi:hypothetical protein